MIQEPINKLNKELSDLLIENDEIQKVISTKRASIKKIERKFKTKKYLAKMQEIEKLYEKQDKIEEKINYLKKITLNNSKLLLKEIEKEIEQSPNNLVISPTDIKLMEKFQGINQKLKLETMKDIMLVHKTRYAPSNNRISTGLETKGQNHATVTLAGKNYQINFPVGQNSIHFALNGPVANHDLGDWSDCKYAVLVPLEEVNKQNLIAFAPEDTYFEGGVNLTKNSIIVCPAEDMEQLKQKNKSVKIIGYQNTTLDDAINTILMSKNIRVCNVTNHGWVDFKSYNTNSRTRELNNIIKENKLPPSLPHYASENALERNIYNAFSFLIRTIAKVCEKNLVVSMNEMKKISDIMRKLLFQGNFSPTISNELSKRIQKNTNIMMNSLFANNYITNERAVSDICLQIKWMTEGCLKERELKLSSELDYNGDYINLYVQNIFLILNRYLKDKNQDNYMYDSIVSSQKTK